MKYCTKCGNPIADNAKYCSFCGARIINDSAPKDHRNYRQERRKQQSEDGHQRSRVRVGPMIAAIILFGIATLFVVISFFIDEQKKALIESLLFF